MKEHVQYFLSNLVKIQVPKQSPANLCLLEKIFFIFLVLANDNIQNFIPEYIRKKFQEQIEPNLCTIKAVCKAQQKE